MSSKAAAADGVPQHIKELVGFLNDRNQQVRFQAAELVCGICASPEGHQLLRNTDAALYLCRMVGDSNEKLASLAIQSLINLSEDPHYVPKMLKGNVISRLLDMILENPNLSNDTMLHCIQLLSNVTISEEGAKKVLNLDEPSLRGYYLTKLVTLFLKQIERTDTDKYGWIALILTNATQLKEGREMILDPKRGIIKAILPFIEDQHGPMRRRGVLATIRNCLFEREHHYQFLDPQLDFLSYLLMPIRGNEVFTEEKDRAGMPRRLLNVSLTKTRDFDIETRRMVIDCLTLLTSTRAGRTFLKDNKAFPIIREYDRVEEEEELSNNIYKLVHVLLLDDPEDNPGEQLTIEPAPASAVPAAKAAAPSNKKEEAEKPAEKPVVAEAPKAAQPKPKPAPKIDLDETGQEIEEL